MYAVIRTGGKQYRVKEGDRLKVESLAGEPGDTVTLGTVLMVGEGDSATIGTPLVSDASVSARVIGQARAKKVRIVKFKRRKHYRRQGGHRQHYTELEITGIDTGDSDRRADAEH